MSELAYDIWRVIRRTIKGFIRAVIFIAVLITVGYTITLIWQSLNIQIDFRQPPLVYLVGIVAIGYTLVICYMVGGDL